MDKRRVVVTGLGLISPCGTGVERSWEALIRGQSGVGPITHFDASGLDCRIAGEVKDFRPEDFIDRRELRRMDRFCQFAVAAADMALKDSGLAVTAQNAERVAVIVGSGIGGLGSLEETYRRALEKGPDRISPFFILQMIINMAPGYISIRHGIKGPSWSSNSACSTSAHALGEAFRGIQRGDFDAAVVGGAEAPVTLLGVGGFAAMKALSTRNDAPQQASRPFDVDRDGFVVAEGAGMLVLEAWESALARGAKVYAELTGYGASSDAYHVTQPAPEHEGAQRSMRLALKDAQLAPSDIGYINAHGTSTDLGDVLEMEGIASVFGAAARGVAVSSTKSMTGHMNGAAGAAEAVISVLALQRGILPPTINIQKQDPRITLDCIPNNAREQRVDAVMSNSFGFGGTNVSLVFQRPR
ncbi:beta-ketoacyl-ACP synthase II [Stigmatella aurantiaca]|uniref:3-oxoacyl-[acyl-carrier-protein] synthase 2 n=1 Tax=Stigmatella aurantiaca (strain DW4/3-1) TaxID=378806 RepID=Q099S7_STIAD|nr:beta-ketoacyl-ACP synthase II [Stigmatella aurantiaca]ADO73110.1 Beta-ketoacyl-acyl carrier protein synthase II [Stigmatella aurantiaca DW4/3-1]EAU68534.1 beta-ketoacyl-acyl carrier protein synthase II [Stigmatella aurantiaca DW4/3-1]